MSNKIFIDGFSNFAVAIIRKLIDNHNIDKKHIFCNTYDLEENIFLTNFLKKENISHLNELDRFELHQELEMILPSFIFYLPQNLRCDWLNRWRDGDDKLFHPSNLLNGDLIKKNLKIQDGHIIGNLLQYL